MGNRQINGELLMSSILLVLFNYCFFACMMFYSYSVHGQKEDPFVPECANGNVESCRSTCQGGNMTTCHVLGSMYVNGHNVKQDIQQGLKYIQHACDQGRQKACIDLFHTYVKRTPLQKSMLRIRQLGIKLCEQKEAEICGVTAHLHKKNEGGAIDYKMARTLNQKGCELGHALVCYNLARSYQINEGVEADQVSKFKEENLKKALFYYQRACKLEDEPSCKKAEEIKQQTMVIDQKLTVSQLRTLCKNNRVKACEMLCQQGGNRDCFYAGVLYHLGRNTSQDFVKARSFYQLACDQDFKLACANLGHLYMNGKGGKVDKKLGFLYTNKACQAGDAMACDNLAEYYRVGKGVHKDIQKALSLYTQACNQGQMTACRNLGGLYADGKEVKQDLLYAQKLFMMGCTEDDESCEFLASLTARLHEKNKGKENQAEVSTSKGSQTTTKKRTQLIKACKKKDFQSCKELAIKMLNEEKPKWDHIRKLLGHTCKKAKLGCIHFADALYKGLGGKHKKSRAQTLYHEACERQESEACLKLGVMYDKDKNVVKSNQYFKKGCDQNHDGSCYQLALNYYNGSGVEKSETKAALLLEKSCNRKDIESCNSLAFLRLEQKKFAPARVLFKQACQADVTSACHYLGLLYLQGLGGEKKVEASKQVFTQACQKGYRKSCIKVKEFQQGVSLLRDFELVEPE